MYKIKKIQELLKKNMKNEIITDLSEPNTLNGVLFLATNNLGMPTGIEILSGAMIFTRDTYRLNINDNWYNWNIERMFYYIDEKSNWNDDIKKLAKKRVKEFIKKYPNYDVWEKHKKNQNN